MIRIKNFLFLICLFIIIKGTAQDSTNITESSFSGVIQIDNVAKEELYKKAKFWMLKNLKSNDNMTNLEDVEHNYMIGSNTNLLEEFYYSGSKKVLNPASNFKIVLRFKDNRISYNITNILITYRVDVTVSRGTSSYLTSRTINTSLVSLKQPPNLTNIKKVNLFVSTIKNDVHSKIDTLILDLEKSMKSESNDSW